MLCCKPFRVYFSVWGRAQLEETGGALEAARFCRIGCTALAFCDVVWRWPAMAGSDRRGEGKLVWLGPRVSDDASPQWRLARSDARDRAVGRRGEALGRPPLGRVGTHF